MNEGGEGRGWGGEWRFCFVLFINSCQDLKQTCRFRSTANGR